MADVGMMFKAPMVHALQREVRQPGQGKTQTRRRAPVFDADVNHARIRTRSGDRIWVRETWKPVHDADPSRGARYRADAGVDQTTWKPALHMPRWASRLTLIVTEVRVQRLREISQEDARAEGLEWVSPTFGIPGIAVTWDADPCAAYFALWDHINGAGAAASNPWVVATSFSVHACNIDALEGEAHG